MRLVSLDFETYYSTDYSLSKLTTEAYVRDPRFEVIGCAVSIDFAPAVWLTPAQFAVFAKGDFSDVAISAHHTHFDGLILAHHYGVRPAYWFDTLSMSRAIHGSRIGNGLDALMKYYEIGSKGDAVVQAKGKHLADFTPEEYKAYGVYAGNDTWGHQQVFKRLLPHFPRSELDLIDTTIRMYTEPVLLIDEPRLGAYLVTEIERKRELLEQCGITKEELSSADKFAHALRSIGVEPATKVSGKGNVIYAFAKSDPEFKELEEHEDEDVRLLCEARLAVKSTLNETRTGRLLRMGAGGRACPVYLKYYGAHTGRWSGGDKLNWQNFERTNKRYPHKGTIRKSIVAPPGYKIVVADSAQIEARFTAWLAGQLDLTGQFARGEDVYSLFASEAYGRPIDRKANPEDEVPGHVGKTCFGPDTPVLTNRGIIPITAVRPTDLLWDGEEWVAHGGVICQGEKEVIETAGVLATPDHAILTERGWATWLEAHTRTSLFQSAVRLALLSFSVGNEEFLRAADRLDTTRSANARAGGRGLLTDKTSSSDDQRDVTPALNLPRQAGDIGSIATQCRKTTIESGSSTDWPRPSRGADLRKLAHIEATVGAAFAFAKNGLQIARRFFGMFALSPVGTCQRSNSTASTTTEITNPGTSGSPRENRTQTTAEKFGKCKHESQNSKRKLLVFDVVNAGPRHRFTVITKAGPVLVHNCVLGLGFGMGWFKLAGELLKGPLGSPPVQFTREDMAKLGVDPSRFLANPKNVEKIREMPSRLNEVDRMIHCAVANHFVEVYRRKNAFIPALWKLADKAIERMFNKQTGPHFYLGILSVVDEGLRLPNGMLLRYPHLTNHDGSYSYLSGKNRRTYMWGGYLTENIVQACCRIIVSDAMLRLRREYLDGTLGGRGQIATMSHDEIVAVVPENYAGECLSTMIDFMKKPPTWAPGLPLNAEGGIGDTYGEAK